MSFWQELCYTTNSVMRLFGDALMFGEAESCIFLHFTPHTELFPSPCSLLETVVD